MKNTWEVLFIGNHKSPSEPPQNLRKNMVFWCIFQWIYNDTNGMKWVKKILYAGIEAELHQQLKSFFTKIYLLVIWNFKVTAPAQTHFIPVFIFIQPISAQCYMSYSVAFHMTGFYMKCNAGIKWVNRCLLFCISTCRILGVITGMLVQSVLSFRIFCHGNVILTANVLSLTQLS